MPYGREALPMPETTVDTAPALEAFLQASWGSLTMEKVLSSLLLLLACLVAIRVVMALTERLLNRAVMEARVRGYVLRGLRTALYVVAALVVAGSLGVDVTSLIALVSIFGLAVSLAVQDTLSNVAGGIVLLFSKPFAVGDYIAAADSEGTVAELTLTHTRLDTYDGLRVTLPNSKLTAGKIVNYTVRGVRRADHALQVSYDCGTEAVKAACLKAVSRTPHVLAEPAPQAVIAAYGESAVEYRVRFWTQADHFWDASYASLEEIRRAFAEDGIVMTYNHLNVHILDGKAEVGAGVSKGSRRRSPEKNCRENEISS